MERTRVKICGITCLEDALSAVDAGADAIGFVFYGKSPRYIMQQKAADIAYRLPPFVSKVGLFVNESEEGVFSILENVPIDLLQFHGEEKPTVCKSYGLPYIKAVRMKGDVDVYRVCDDYAAACALLLDGFVEDVHGGTGEVFAWSRVPKDLKQKVVLAGGLTPENVAEAVTAVAPYAVDVSGGVEASKGIKDVRKIEKFIRAVRHA